ncbi:MAG: PepSY-like domain-containing protein [Tannerellaceae bacterium]|nr:PepSY-like domain-containing protein [Tannerellaceae bacterium]
MKYPNADAILWDEENGFYVAHFTWMSVPVNAWFSKEGEWILSENEHSFMQIHPNVPKAFYRSSYSEWDIEQIKMLERKGMDTIYVVSVTQSNRLTHLYYSKYGDFIKASSNVNNTMYAPASLPYEIRRTLSRLFDSPQIIDFWEDDLAVNAAIREGNNYCLVVFTFSYEWLCTFRNIGQADLKPSIWEKFQSSEYGVYTVTQLRTLQNESGLSYVFYFLDEDKRSYILFIKENGNFDCVVSY